MQRVRRGRSNLRVAPGSSQRQRGQRRIIETVNQVVSHARVLGFSCENFVENLGGLLLIRVRFVRWYGGAQQRERIEDGGLVVLWVTQINLLHRFLVSEG